MLDHDITYIDNMVIYVIILRLNHKSIWRLKMLNSVVLADAEKVAKTMASNPNVRGVEIFGSVARDGVGNDLDIILLIDTNRFSSLYYDIAEFPYYGAGWDFFRPGIGAESTKLMRIELIQETLEMEDEMFRAEQLVGFGNMDIFVMDPKWRERLDYHQEMMEHRDPNFMCNIARDAVRLA